jgi:peptidyl-prolyl cis-trans isomerase B (cyclophilin B)
MGMQGNLSRWVIAVTLFAVCDLGVGLGAEDPNSPLINSDQERTSYLIGTQVARALREQGIAVNIEMLLRGIRDGLAGRSLLSGAAQTDITVQVRRPSMQSEKAQQQDRSAGKPQDNKWKLELKQPERMTFDPGKDYFWILDTNKGTIKIKLMPQVAPMHVTSTIFLTNKGFYDNLRFHRVIPGFMAQGGCPLGTGTGQPGYQYDSEIDPKVKHDRPYRLSMANAGVPRTDGSQFFLTFKATPWLDGKHTVFGDVVEGQDVVRKLEAAGTPDGTPRETLTIVKARIEEKSHQS